MRPFARLLPLLLVLLAGGLLAWYVLDSQAPDGSADLFDREHADPASGEDLSAGTGMALTGEKGRARPKAAEPGDAEAEGPKAPTFPPSEGVSGRVLDGSRAPIAKASVTLHPMTSMMWWNAPDEAPVAEAESAKDGTFLVGPAPESRLKVRAVAPGFAPSVVIVPRRGGRVELVLDVGGGLNVKVVDGKGAPVADASVQHLAGAWTAQVVSEALTDKDGIARFAAVPTGSGQVIVTKAGLGLVRQPDVGVPPRLTTDITVVLQGGRVLTGQVLNGEDSRPVAGATIEVRYPWVQGVKPSAPVTSDEDGRYKVPIDVPTGEQFELRVTHASFAETRVWLNYNDNGTGSMKHDPRLGQGAQGLSGRVVGRDGGAVAGASITYGNAQPGQTLPRATSDAEGRFELAAPVGGAPGTSWLVIAQHPTEGIGYSHGALPQKNESRAKAVEVRLAGSGALAGVVKDGGGQPVGGATISLTPDWSSMQRGGGRGGRGFDWQLMNVLQDPGVSTRLTAVSDAEGRYAIGNVPLASYQVSALWGGLSATHEAPVEIRAGDTAKADLTLGEGATIEGIVLDGEDRPVAGAMLWAQPAQQRPGAVAVYPSARAQSDGRFVLRGVSPGAYQINGSAAGYGQDVLRNVEAGTRDVTMRLKSMGWIDGQVLVDNQPYAGTFTVMVKRVAGRGTGRAINENEGSFDGQEAQVFNHPEGLFQKKGLRGGDYVVTASTPDGLVMLEGVAASVVEGRGAGPVRLTLTRGASIVGEVEGSDGQPLKGGWVYASAVQGQGVGPEAYARVDETGTFALRGLGSGLLRLQVSTDQGSSWTEQVDVLPGQERRVRFVERAPGRLRVTVQDPDGARLAKARPQVLDATGNEVHPNWQLLRRDGVIDGRTGESWERATSTDESGQCTRHHLPPGRYRLRALLQGYEAEGEGTWVEVASGAITDVTITLKPAGR